MPLQFDYIITGAGCAGLSLLMRLLQEPAMQQKKILVIDKDAKKNNDRTWCFWEASPGLFEPIVHHRWEQLRFVAPAVDTNFSITPYQYKMIRGIDFYEYVLQQSAGFDNVQLVYATVQALRNENNGVTVVTDHGTYTGEYVFNSIVNAGNWPPDDFKGYFLWQHFKGKLIETNQPVFDPSMATFMDFTVSQHNGTTFMYVLPFTSNTALVEYTLFTKQLLAYEVYDAAIDTYLQEKYGVGNGYHVLHEEFGKIPMTNYHFTPKEGHIIHIGIAGGQAKGSSGYAFYFIQQQTEAIVKSLLQFGQPKLSISLQQRKFRWFDSVLLRVLQKQLLPGHEVFAAIFKQNAPDTILRFLNNESSINEDIQIMRSVPMCIFLPAALHTVFFRR
ncbi:MAG: lycopene cyclase [Hydrotalea flava]|uniref:lycopene cyclase family protein n=1 Tax=Hydrotalea TaxID=1004300 RepID=UPI0009C19293|nr:MULTISPECIES: lycopene cyclase family protein [Hydrotalea]MBY0346864.1 hypothetical protein [Hydrotalea flava]GHV14961.1 lycopene cyclase [Spirochaetia bacterium]NIM34383.1 lycopene cyclase [Hydrotalea flava]NIM37209.1 lycopene cyclase [Hydrotalea flava]NIN02402.1 lycopene cyclase [Hydrotalea flava]